MTHVWLRTSMHALCRSSVLMPSSPSSKSRISWAVAMSSSPFNWRDWHIATDSSASMSPRYVHWSCKFSHFPPLPTISVAAFPQIDLSHAQAKGGLADLCIRQDFAHRRKGNCHFMRSPLLPLTPSFSSRSKRKSIQHSIPSTWCYANFANLSQSCPPNAVPIILSLFHAALFMVLFRHCECTLACVSPALFTSAHPVVDRRMVIHVGAKGTIEICVLWFKEVS